jgi:hypothetical protein
MRVVTDAHVRIGTELSPARLKRSPPQQLHILSLVSPLCTRNPLIRELWPRLL